jgi:hypothetical protein
VSSPRAADPAPKALALTLIISEFVRISIKENCGRSVGCCGSVVGMWWLSGEDVVAHEGMWWLSNEDVVAQWRGCGGSVGGVWWLSGWDGGAQWWECGGSVVNATADCPRLQTQQSRVRIRLPSQSPERGQEITTV